MYLYNCLNNISFLISAEDKKQALQALSDNLFNKK